jgi:hypothetical protein
MQPSKIKRRQYNSLCEHIVFPVTTEYAILEESFSVGLHNEDI